MRLYLTLVWAFLFVGVYSQECSCSPTRVVQKVWGDNDIIFFGTIATTNGRMQATVSIPLKGCLQIRQKVPLTSAGPCALNPPAGKGTQTWLVTGTVTDGKVNVDTCGWTSLKSRVATEDVLWLMNQFEQCPNQGNITCANNRAPLNCDRSICDLSACPGTTTCETNACYNCAVQYLTSDRKLKCGELAGSEYEHKLCPTCKVDPCAGKTAADLKGSCQDWQQAVTCLARPCSGCHEPIWLDVDGRQVCSAKTDLMQCVDLGGVRFNSNCASSSILGYANIRNQPCVPVQGCLPLPNDVTLFKTAAKCRESCMCEDFSKVDMKYNASDPACNQELGWALIKSQCAIVKGCKALKSASSIVASIYSTQALCQSSCGTMIKDYEVVNGRPIDWVDAANGPDAAVQYSKVFPRNKVNRMDFTFEPAEFARMKADLESIMKDYAAVAQASGALNGRRLLQFGGGGGKRGRQGNQGRQSFSNGGGGGGGNDMSDMIRQVLLQKLLGGGSGSDPMLAALMGNRNPALQAPPPNLFVQPPTPKPSSMQDAATKRALDKMFAGDANPDGTCHALCGSGGYCPPRRDASQTSFGFNERGVEFSRDPEYFKTTISFQGNTWHNVGIRYKGGSSLSGAYFLQSQMIGFRVSLDEYDGEYPELKNQKFFGFSKLTFSNNWMDKSHIREILSYEILGASGVKAARATPVRVYFDIGDGKGPTFWGVYTMVEDPTDVVVQTFPGDLTPGEGNIYKPENNTWEKFVADDFEKKNNAKKNVSFADISGAIQALHAPTRLTNPPVWRQRFEAVFDVASFIKSLAATSIIGNWDTYGSMPHNYYLYNLNGQLKWIPWDFNLALNCDDRTTSIFKDEIGNEWPLISFLMADPVYRSNYTSFVQWLVTSGPFVTRDLIARKNQLFALVTPHIVGLADPNDPTIKYEPELPPHTTMYDPSSFPAESARMDNYLNQRANIVQIELNAQAQSRVRLG